MAIESSASFLLSRFYKWAITIPSKNLNLATSEVLDYGVHGIPAMNDHSTSRCSLFLIL